MQPFARAALGVATAGAVGIGYASLVERNLFVVRRHTLPVLPPGSRSLRVVHVTDLHLMPGQRRKVEWIRGLAALEPDLVVNTGDNIAHPESIGPLLRAFEPLLDVPGVFVMGSNDYFAPRLKNPARYLMTDHRRGSERARRLPTERLIEGLTSAGWTELTNRRTRLTLGGSGGVGGVGGGELEGVELEFVGVDDPHLDYDRLDLVAGPAARDVALTVGVTHAPYQRVLDAMTIDGAGLVIAGHTHGGQLCLPLWGALVTNCDLDTRRAKGVSRWWPGAGSAPSSQAPEGAAYLEVSAGLGTSPMAPVRFACRPEASLLTLVPRDA